MSELLIFVYKKILSCCFNACFRFYTVRAISWKQAETEMMPPLDILPNKSRYDKIQQ
ncbi:MAG: hypothetical protein ACRCUY_11605 [Thermoguttaceae bacterium]